MYENNRLKILYVSTEVSPFAKTGGLADVAGSLPIALSKMGNDIRIVTPRYKMISDKLEYVMDFPVTVGLKKETCIIKQTSISYNQNDSNGNIPVYFIDNYHYFDRDGLYGYNDDGERFAFFCKSVINMLPLIDFKPDIIHCNDWQTGPICMMLNETYKKYQFYSEMATVYTIHNLKFQGCFPKEIITILDVGEEVLAMSKSEFFGTFSFAKSGLSYADIITTVSETYSKEIQTSMFGENMDGILRHRKNDLYGVINGINCDEFNPETDTNIFFNYNKENFYNIKKENKFALQTQLGLPVKDVPVIGIVSRLSFQKGLDLVINSIDEILKDDVQFVVLGAGEYYIEEQFRKIKERYPEKFSLYLGYNMVLAHKIYAGLDMFLMPSQFEPCGLGQIISFRYGTIPIVRSTGGLADTVIDIDKDKNNGNGFCFNNYFAYEMLNTVKRALRLYWENIDGWHKLILNAFDYDCSWDKSANKYMEFYYKALKK